MILIIGGLGQGKRDFARRQFVLDARKGNNVFLAEEEVNFADGGVVSWSDFLKARYACNLHLMIRRRMETGEQVNQMAEALLEACSDRILITDEIGYGIVPAGRFEREYRETTGRICCKLAAEAKAVWRVTAGIGMQLK